MTSFATFLIAPSYQWHLLWHLFHFTVYCPTPLSSYSNSSKSTPFNSTNKGYAHHERRFVSYQIKNGLHFCIRLQMFPDRRLLLLAVSHASTIPKIKQSGFSSVNNSFVNKYFLICTILSLLTHLNWLTSIICPYNGLWPILNDFPIWSRNRAAAGTSFSCALLQLLSPRFDAMLIFFFFWIG